MKHVLPLLAIAAAVSVALAQGNHSEIKRLDGSTIHAAEIDHTVTRLMKAAQVTGVGLAVFNNGNIAYLKAYGFRDTARQLPLTVNSVMSGASLSKAAFAFMAMTLVDEGVLDLDKPVYQYLPQPISAYPDYADLVNDSRYRRITARMLLSHTSGFANWRAFEEDRRLKIHFEPGTRYAYSGEGIDLLQLVVETITKSPLEQLMQERLFQPLGMTSTSMLWQDSFESDYANGYDEYGRSLGATKWRKADAAGSLQTTTADFARFMLEVMKGRLLRINTRSQMLSPQIQIRARHQFPTLSSETTDQNKTISLSYGLGWGLYWTPYGKAIFKEGHDAGWRNYTVCFDEQKMGIVIMTNSGNGEGIFKDLLETLLKNPFTPIEWEGYTPYDKLPARKLLKQHTQVTVDAKVLDRYVGRYAIPPDILLTVRREGDHLSMQENDEPRQDLLPESETDFFSSTADDLYTFVCDKEGQAIAVILHTDGKNIRVKRID